MNRSLVSITLIATLLALPGLAQRPPASLAATEQPVRPEGTGDPLHTTYFSQPCPYGGLGIAFDGQYLWYSCNAITGDPNLFKADALSGAVLASFASDVVGSLGALAWDNNRQELWAGVHDHPSGTTSVYRIDPTTGGATLVFGFPDPEGGFYFALAYDPQDDTLYMPSYDPVPGVLHVDTAGAILGSWPLAYYPYGLAIAGDLLYVTLPDTGLDYITARAKASGAFQFQFLTIESSNRDLECDSITFAPLTALWSVSEYDPRRATAYEIPAAACTGGVRNLASAPGAQPQDVALTWKAPDAGGGASAAAYDIRFSDLPIDANTWNTATQLQDEPFPSPPGTNQQMALHDIPLNTRWYFALKFQYPAGSWSPLSNVPSLLDMGFRSSTHGYSFPNFGDVQDTDLTLQDMITLFDSQLAVCYNPIGPCIPRPPAALWRAQALGYMTGGHCAGMSASSLRFFVGLDLPGAFQPGATTAHDLFKPNARRQISYYWVPELLDPLAGTRVAQRAIPPSDTVDQLLTAMASPASDPLNLDVYLDGVGGHSITPFAVEERQDDWRVWVYNNNFPNISSTVIITTTNETWRYDMGPNLGVWSGNAGTQSLAVYPISTFAQTLDCPWCLFSQGLSAQPQAAGSAQVWLTGGHGLITDSQGRRMGYAGMEFVNEMPGAIANFVPGGLGVEMEPIYTIPLTETYSILLDGQTLTDTQTASLVQFGPGYASGAQDIPAGPSTQDQVVIAADGSEVAYQASSNKQVTLLLATDSPTDGYQFQFEGADLTAGQPVTGTMDAANGQLIYNNHEAGDGAYDLAITRANASGQSLFFHSQIAVLATDIHYLEYADWDGVGSMTLLIDHSGDGTIDETIMLNNQSAHVYLPLVMNSP